MPADDFSRLVRQRRTVRDFRPTPIPDETLDAILDDARHAPSWSNTRPYCVAIASGERLERLRQSYLQAFDAALGLYHRRPAAIAKGVLLGRWGGLPDDDFRTWRPYPADLRPRSQQVGKALYLHQGIQRGDRAARDAAARRNLEFFGAPTVLWLFVHKGLLPFSAQDAGLMLQTLMLAAQARGVNSCPLGVLATWRHPVDAEFQIPANYGLITGLALGYASDDPVNDFRAEHPPLVRAIER
ncbi:MAG: nitroreductase [Propionibacteriaceae bacterium]|nr:nitroreductase [Propionibacteriaceae bacterium]